MVINRLLLFVERSKNIVSSFPVSHPQLAPLCALNGPKSLFIQHSASNCNITNKLQHIQPNRRALKTCPSSSHIRIINSFKSNVDILLLLKVSHQPTRLRRTATRPLSLDWTCIFVIERKKNCVHVRFKTKTSEEMSLLEKKKKKINLQKGPGDQGQDTQRRRMDTLCKYLFGSKKEKCCFFYVKWFPLRSLPIRLHRAHGISRFLFVLYSSFFLHSSIFGDDGI